MKIRHILLLLAIMVLTVGCDQVAKKVATLALAGSPPRVFANGMVRFEYAENQGAILSLGATLPAEVRHGVFVVGVSLLLLIVLLVVLRHTSLAVVEVMGFGLILGGGVGNLIDRLLYDGVVIDYVSIGIGRLRTGVFNIADVAVMGGSFLLLILWLGRTERSEKAGPITSAEWEETDSEAVEASDPAGGLELGLGRWEEENAGGAEEHVDVPPSDGGREKRDG